MCHGGSKENEWFVTHFLLYGLNLVNNNDCNDNCYYSAPFAYKVCVLGDRFKYTLVACIVYGFYQGRIQKII